MKTPSEACEKLSTLRPDTQCKQNKTYNIVKTVYQTISSSSLAPRSELNYPGPNRRAPLPYSPEYTKCQMHEPGLKLVDEQGFKAITQESDVLPFPTLFDNQPDRKRISYNPALI